MSIHPFKLFPLRLWLLPLGLFLVTCPLWLQWFEPAMFIYLNTLCAPVAAPVWTALSLLGNGWGVLGVTAPLLVLAPRLMWAWLCAAPFAIVFARTGKFLLDSPRPAAVVDNAHMRIVGETLHNVAMPSGHTLTAFAVASALYFAIAPARRARYAWLWILAAGAGLSRIAVGAHWPGDVAVGASLGVLSGLLGNVLLKRMGPRHCQPTAWSLRAVAALVALAVYHLLFDTLDFAQNLPFQYVLAVVAGGALAAFAWRNFKHKNSL
jgi:membrane-associated phospholipid phosphatase